MDLDDRYKRPNKETGKPFEEGFEDINGRVFVKYLNKQGNDGYYFEEWKKEFNPSLAKKD
ncbi:MAG: hypothetical protein P8O14_03690 [SAR86 cluster bacterium]|jgi:5-formaminoimidazole-4-carboxamide-1-beta-D-ribofuranosyl 5'-monophosphate synthetase|nr:hypothetical protein [SAR86 cluster bacterium]MDG1948588.1 hypothetical protein [SAR86 cluster bacterium]MDG2092426.1 hypothetical protein [SAR86 cluster bacterium]|tara:strand:+ start:4455 stop:4634 length:180 start_codon:yes stop_codon:yes gene_type:complete